MTVATGHRVRVGHEAVVGYRAWRAGVSLPVGGFAMLALLLIATALPAAAQIVPTPNPGRDCQTVRTCNFARGAAVRGCLSSYTCRTCRLVRSRCSVGNRRQVCEQMVCSWGG